MAFVGIDGPARANMTEDGLVQAARAQLGELFGEHAGHPKYVHLMDWSTEPLTAAPTDRRAPTQHPQYGLRPQLADVWQDRLHLVGSETSRESGGLIEGALERGFAFANTVIRSPGIS